MDFKGELFMRSPEGYYGAYLLNCAAMMEINIKITFESAHKQFFARLGTFLQFFKVITDP